MAVCNVSFVALPDQTSVFFFFFREREFDKGNNNLQQTKCKRREMEKERKIY